MNFYKTNNAATSPRRAKSIAQTIDGSKHQRNRWDALTKNEALVQNFFQNSKQRKITTILLS